MLVLFGLLLVCWSTELSDVTRKRSAPRVAVICSRLCSQPPREADPTCRSWGDSALGSLMCIQGGGVALVTHVCVQSSQQAGKSEGRQSRAGAGGGKLCSTDPPGLIQSES